MGASFESYSPMAETPATGRSVEETPRTAIGAMMRLRRIATAWKDALTRLRMADFEAIKHAFPTYSLPDVIHSMEESIEALQKSDQACYLDLAVFPEDQPVPE